MTKRTFAPIPGAANFLNLDFYSGGGALPEGDYVWEKVDIVMHKGFDASRNTPERLGVMIHLKDLHDLSATVRPIFASMGSQAHLSFVPLAQGPKAGKGLMAIPGGKAATLNQSTNWAILFKSLVDCDPTIMQLGTNDVSVFEGMWTHMNSIPEPDERKGFAATASTGEVGQQPQENRNRTTPVVTQIHDEGKPWEGTGGVPTTSPFGTGKPNGAPAVVTATPVMNLAKDVTVTVDDDVRTAVSNGLTEALGKLPQGGPRLLIRNTVSAHIKKTYGDKILQSAINGFMLNESTDAQLNDVLGELGYIVQNNQIRPMQ